MRSYEAVGSHFVDPYNRRLKTESTFNLSYGNIFIFKRTSL